MDIKKGFLVGTALGFAFGLGCATAATVIPPALVQVGVFSSANRLYFRRRL